LTRLGDGSGKLGALAGKVDKGVEQAQKLAKTYNKIGQWCGLPAIPDAFL